MSPDSSALWKIVTPDANRRPLIGGLNDHLPGVQAMTKYPRS